jgi:hypothetical protein
MTSALKLLPAILLAMLPLARTLHCASRIRTESRRSAAPVLNDSTQPSDEVFSVRDIVAESRARSRAEGRKGCCYKASDYLSQTASAPAEASQWARAPRAGTELAPAALPHAKPSLLSQLSAEGAVAYQARDSRPLDGKPAPKYCKFDAVRDSMAAARARRSPGRQPWRPS